MRLPVTQAFERMSSHSPETLERSILGARDTATASARFLNENFRGLIEVRHSVESGENIKISEEHLAHFFKLLIKYTNLRCYLTVTMTVAESVFCLTVEKGSQADFTEEQSAKLIKSAKRAGFSVKMEQNRLLLKTSVFVTDHPAAYIYTKNLSEIENAFFKIFF